MKAFKMFLFAAIAFISFAAVKFHKVNQQSKQLQKDGYCREWAEKISLTEQGFIKPDSVYFDMIND